LSVITCSFLLFITAAICQAADIPGEAIFKSPEATVSVNISSSIYTYKVTNLDTDRITGFEIEQHASYDFIVPEGWEKETSLHAFKAYTTKPAYAIELNKTGEFSLRVSSRGAILGKRPVKITFESGKTITIPGVRAPAAEPKSYIALVAGMILAIIVIQTVIATRKSRRPNQTN
jgi:hypothetical protein